MSKSIITSITRSMEEVTLSGPVATGSGISATVCPKNKKLDFQARCTVIMLSVLLDLSVSLPSWRN
jgi:hypothetical protein